MTTEALMTKAEKKHDTQKPNNEWNTPSKEQEEIAALKAKIGALQKLRKHGSKQTPKGGPKGDSNQNPLGTKDQEKKGKGPGFKGKCAWCKTAPKPGESWS